MNDEIAVKISHVSKSFRLPTETTNSLRTALVNRVKGIKGYQVQHVLKDIDFEVKKGDFFGIVGRNGSGKSTLLKIISQIYTPEKGDVLVNGNLVSFIELGVGFNPELTGRENIYLNGAMLGFSVSEIDEMYDEIVDFAELEEFMNQKLKNYSSGMQVRLAFSVAIKAKGDVLVLDEVLAVGDESFQRKCNDYFFERKKSGQTTILVTHDMGAVQKYCNRAIFIKNGELDEANSISDVTSRYSESNNLSSNRQAGISNNQAQISINPKSKTVLTSENDEFVFEIEHSIMDRTIVNGKNLYVAYNIFDKTRGGIVFDSGPIKVESKGKLEFKIPMKNFHNTEFSISAHLAKEKSVDSTGYIETSLLTHANDITFTFRNNDDKKNYALLKEL